MSFTKVNEILIDFLKNLAILPYRYVYRRNTRDPINEFLKVSGSNCQTKLEIWLKLKLHEAQYVQVAVGSPDFACISQVFKPISSNGRMSYRVQYYSPRQQPRYPGQQSQLVIGLALRSGTRHFCSR